MLLLIRQDRDMASYFNTWNLYDLKGEYGNVWKLPSRGPLVRSSVFLFFEPLFLSSACPHVSLSYPEYSGFLIAATQAAKYEAEYEAITRLNDCD